MKSVAMVIALVAACGAPAMANIVDPMLDGEFVLTGTSSTVAAGEGAHILGGMRRVSLIQSGPGASIALKLIDESLIRFENDDEVSSTLVLEYGDFIGGDGPLNADFASHGSAIAVNIASVNGLGVMCVTVESSSGAGRSQWQIVDKPGIYAFAFTEPGFESVDFGDIDRVTIELAALPGADFVIGAVGTSVPAPSALALLGLGAAGIARRRR